MKRIILMLAAFALAMPSFAQFGNFNIGKALEIGKKAVEANKEFSQEDEIQLGNGLTAGLLGASPLHKDERLQRYVNRVGRWVAAHSERADLPWTFGVLETDTINAFAMPGGMIVVSHGLLRRLQSESELAGVLGHEIAHVVQKHQLKAIQGGAWGDVLGAVGQEVVDRRIARSGAGAVGGAVLSGVGAQGVELITKGFLLRPLDRSMEYEADRMAVVIAARSGYDPYGFIAVLQMLGQHQGDGSRVSVFDTHPAAADRMGELEGFMSASLDRFAGQGLNDARFRQVLAPR